MLIGLFSVTWSAYFFIIPRTTSPSTALPTGNRAFLHQLLVKKMLQKTDLYRPVWWGHLHYLRFFFPYGCSSWEVKKKNKKQTDKNQLNGIVLDQSHTYNHVLLTRMGFSIHWTRLSLFDTLRLFFISSLVLFEGLWLIKDDHKLSDSPATEIASIFHSSESGLALLPC